MTLRPRTMTFLLLRTAPLLAVLAVSACSSRGVTQLRAQVRGWTGGEGRIEVLNDDLKTLATTPLDASGRFNLPLPGPEQLAGSLQPSLIPSGIDGCQNTVKVNGDAQYYTLGDLTAFSSQGSKVAYTIVSQTHSTDQARSDKRVMIYVTQPVQVRGELKCGAQSASYRLSLQQGWNYAVSRQSQGNTVIESTGKEGFEGWQVKQ